MPGMNESVWKLTDLRLKEMADKGLNVTVELNDKQTLSYVVAFAALESIPQWGKAWVAK